MRQHAIYSQLMKGVHVIAPEEVTGAGLHPQAAAKYEMQAGYVLPTQKRHYILQPEVIPSCQIAFAAMLQRKAS